jgi:hypothetical protein
MTRRQFVRACVGTLIAVGTAAETRAQTPPLDPQSLIGLWSGSWVNAHEGKLNGKYYLTIDRVVGEKVFGKGEFVGRTATEFKIGGTLSGNQLTFGRTTLTVDGNQMRGTGPDIKISLTKEK